MNPSLPVRSTRLHWIAATLSLPMLAAGPLHAAVLLQYNFGTAIGAETLAPTTQAAGLTGTSITAGAGLSGIRTNQTLSNTSGYNLPVLQVNPNNFSTPEASFAGNAYFSFTATPSSLATLNLDSLTFLASPGGGGTRGYDVRSSADNYAATLGTATLTGSRTAPQSVSIDLSATAFDAVATPLSFRIYVHTPLNSNSVEFDDITLNGVVNAIPEPSSLTLAGLAGVLCAFRRKRA
eukprot:g3960.t1